LRVRMSDGIPLESFTLMHGVGLKSSGQAIPASASSSALAPFSPTPDCSLSCCSWSCEGLRGPPSPWPKVGGSSVVSSIQRRTVCTRMGKGICHLSLGEGRGDTYAARTAVAVVGCDGVSNAITLVVGRWVVSGVRKKPKSGARVEEVVRKGKPRRRQLVTEASQRRKLGEADSREREERRALTHCDEWSSRCGGRLRVRVRELRASKQCSAGRQAVSVSGVGQGWD